MATSYPVRRLWRTQPPTGLPVSVYEARDACQSLYYGDDALILQLIHAAVSHIDGADGVLGRAIMPQQWTLRIDNASGYEIDLPLPPLIEIDSVSLISTDYVGTPVIEPYTVIGDQTILLPATLAFAHVQIAFTCGYTVLPEALKLAILMMVRHWYDHPGVVEVGRVAMHRIPMAVDALLAPFKVQSV